MRHVEKALVSLQEKYPNENYEQFIKILNAEDVVGVAPVVCFTIQSDPVGIVGVNGVQAIDILKYGRELIASLNEAFYSIYNEKCIALLDLAILEQNQRTIDRIYRGVEGQNKE